MAGYFYGLEAAAEKNQNGSLSDPGTPTAAEMDSARSETPAPVTFYSVLTEPRDEAPSPAPQPEPQRVQRVEVEETAPAKPDGNLSLMLQMASYRGREAAERLLENLSAEGYEGTVRVADLGERGIWYRVQIGPYGTEKEAGIILEKLRMDRDLKGYIIR